MMNLTNPTKKSDITIEFAQNWCIANKKIRWMQQRLNERVISPNNGKKYQLSDSKICTMFCAEFFPELMPKPKTPSWRELFLALPAEDEE